MRYIPNVGQTTENQRRELEATASRAGWSIVAIFEDAGVSGSKGRDQRPAFDKLHRAITRREIDVVMAWSVDRLGRSLQDLVAFLGELRAVGCDLYLHQQGVDTTTPAGRALFQMLGVFAEFERAIIVERVRAGIARARGEGKHLGRPRIDGTVEQAIRSALAAGTGIRIRVGVDYPHSPRSGSQGLRGTRFRAGRRLVPAASRAVSRSDGRAGLLNCWSSLCFPSSRRRAIAPFWGILPKGKAR